MGRRTVDFVPPQTGEMRRLWRKHADPDIRRLLLEIDHLRGVLKEDVGGQLVALEKLRYLLVAERVRTGLLDD